MGWTRFLSQWGLQCGFSQCSRNCSSARCSRRSRWCMYSCKTNTPFREKLLSTVTAEPPLRGVQHCFGDNGSTAREKKAPATVSAERGCVRGGSQTLMESYMEQPLWKTTCCLESWNATLFYTLEQQFSNVIRHQKPPGTSVVVQWLWLHAPSAGVSIPGQGTRLHMLPLKHIPHTATKAKINK